MDSSLIINATNSGKKVTKAITNINPEKDNSILKTFAQKVNALTTNSYVDATRVNKMSVEEQGGGGKTEPTLTIDNKGRYSYDGDGEIFGYLDTADVGLYINRVDKTCSIIVTGDPAIPPVTYTITLHATEGTNYAAKTVSYTHVS